VNRRAARERRASPRLPAEDCIWLSSARLRPGPEVVLTDVSEGGARVEAPVRLVPGGHVELVLSGPGWQWSVRAAVVHARVSGLTARGPRYLAGLQFAQRLEVSLLRGARPQPARAG
jgi:hypothetical protein